MELRIGKLCESCLGEAHVDRDCYILDIKLTKGDITTDSFSEQWVLHDNLTVGEHVVKIFNKGSRCEVLKID